MKKLLTRSLAILLALLFSCSPAWATCGGGGGGGGGGMSGGGGSDMKVYYVPWKVRAPQDPPVAMGLVLYWFPATTEEVQKSSLRASRTLSLYAAQCVAMELADYRTDTGKKLLGDSKPPVAVLATPEGTPISKLENKDGKLNVSDVEKLVESEVKKRESALDEQLKSGKDKAKAGDTEVAIKLFRAVQAEKCMFPGKAKDAGKELKKLGVTDVAELPAALIFDARTSTRIEQTMRAGLRAEMGARYVAAEQLYTRAHLLDPADPTPLRYLGE